MKRLVVFCFCLLFGVLSALSILNFDGEAVGAMEGKMSRMMIVKPQGMDNTYFLTAIDNALKDKNADIMMRIVSLEDGKPINRYISKGAYFIKTQTDSPYTELYPLLKASGIEAYTLELRSVADNYEKVIARQLTMLRIFGTQSVFLLIGLFALIIFTASLYCENYKRKIAACMIEGYSLTNCIRGHLILTIFVYGVSILALWAIEKMNVIGITAESLILPIALLLDIAVTYGLCRRYSTANLYSIMKGAE